MSVEKGSSLEAVAQRCCVKKDVLRNFTKFTEKHLRQSLFFNKETFVTSSFFILVYEANTYNLLVQRNNFLKQSPIASLQKCVLQICSKFTGGDPYENVVSKEVAWHICMSALL